eukprot:Sdes_comp20657_c0_seq1m15957
MLSGGFRGGSMMTSPRKANSGGGFMVGNFDSPATESERKKIGGSQTISPVTIRQLLNASQNSMDDTFRVDGKTPAQVRLLFAASTLFNLSLCQDSPLNPHFCWFLKVTFVGAIRSVVEQSTHLIYKVEDGTGEIDVRMWLDSHDSEHKAQQRSAFQEGIYVRVVGQMRTFMDKLSINSYSIRPIADMNEISFHMIEVIYVHLYNTKGALHSHKMVGFYWFDVFLTSLIIIDCCTYSSLHLCRVLKLLLMVGFDLVAFGCIFMLFSLFSP